MLVEQPGPGMQEAAREGRVIPLIVCTRASLCDEEPEPEANNNNGCEPRSKPSALARQRKIARSRVRRNSRRLSALDCARRSASSSRSPSPMAPREPAPGYRQYLELLEVPACPEWSENSGDDLSSEWDSDQSARSGKLTDDEEIENRPIVVKVECEGPRV